MTTKSAETAGLDREGMGRLVDGDEPSLPLVMTVKEVALLLRCGLSTVYEMCENGTLKSFKLKPGSRKGIRVLAESVAALMKPCEAPEPDPPVPPKAKRRPRGASRWHLPSPF